MRNIEFIPGMIVEITGMSKKSYWLYRAYSQKVPGITCACKWKKGTLAIVDHFYEDGSVIITQKENPKIIGITYYSDIAPYYEELDD
jgi:hypothetical protein